MASWMTTPPAPTAQPCHNTPVYSTCCGLAQALDAYGSLCLDGLASEGTGMLNLQNGVKMTHYSAVMNFLLDAGLYSFFLFCYASGSLPRKKKRYLALLHRHRNSRSRMI